MNRIDEMFTDAEITQLAFKIIDKSVWVKSLPDMKTQQDKNTKDIKRIDKTLHYSNGKNKSMVEKVDIIEMRTENIEKKIDMHSNRPKNDKGKFVDRRKNGKWLKRLNISIMVLTLFTLAGCMTFITQASKDSIKPIIKYIYEYLNN